MKKVMLFVVGSLLFQLGAFAVWTNSCTGVEITESFIFKSKVEPTKGIIPMSDMEQYVVFNAGIGSHSYRIPAIVTAKDGSLLLFAEARHETWQDKSYTDIVMKRSTNGGRDWSEMVTLTFSQNGTSYAFMDPSPVVDRKTGKVFLFCTRWNKLDKNVTNNHVFMLTSSDNGKTWSAPEDVSQKVLLGDFFSGGFGPGAGIQIAQGRYTGRLLFTTRQYSLDKGSKGYAVYSDDSGSTWHISSSPFLAGECQIAECGKDQLLVNIRRGSDRYVAKSKDGGQSWSSCNKDGGLPIVNGGCHASVLSGGSNMVFYCGPQGSQKTETNDNRSKLTLYRSLQGGNDWIHQTLYNLASGYSDMTFLPDGRLVIAFEAGSEGGFTYNSNRDAGWMRIDVLILPKEVANYRYWFK